MTVLKDADASATPAIELVSPTCPACHSTITTTTGNKMDESSYWRCSRCGEVWNPGRRRETPRWHR